MESNFVILAVICIISGACCFPSGENGNLSTKAASVATPTVDLKTLIASPGSTSSATVSDVVASNSSTTVIPIPKPSELTDTNTTTTAPNTTTTATTPTTPPTTPPTTTPTPTTPTTTTPIPTTPTTITTTEKTTTTASPATTSVSPSSTTPTPTPAPSHDRHFDGASFIGGMLLTLASLSLVFAVFKVYKSRTERNYHTL